LSTLRHLSISSLSGDLDLFPGTLSTCLRAFNAAIASTLQSLSVILHVNDPFWDDMDANAEHIRLEKLVHGSYGVHHDTKHILLRSIPKFVHLRELCVQYDGDIDLDREFLDAVRKNGSLHRATCQELEDAYPRRLEKADVYCSRNKLVPELLLGPLTEGTSGGLSLCPRLFASVLPAARVAPNTMALGLLSMADLIGPLRASKRTMNFPNAHR
jgi:hypothetical protein